MKLPDNTHVFIKIADRMRAIQKAYHSGDQSKKKDMLKVERMFDRELTEFKKQII